LTGCFVAYCADDCAGGWLSDESCSFFMVRFWFCCDGDVVLHFSGLFYFVDKLFHEKAMPISPAVDRYSDCFF